MIPGCKYCKHLATFLNSDVYHCLRNPYIEQKDIYEIGKRKYKSPNETRNTDKCEFVPTLWYKILKLLGIINV